MKYIPSMIKAADGSYINGDVVKDFFIEEIYGVFWAMSDDCCVAKFDTREEAQKFLDWLVGSIGTVIGFAEYEEERAST